MPQRIVGDAPRDLQNRRRVIVECDCGWRRVLILAATWSAARPCPRCRARAKKAQRRRSRPRARTLAQKKRIELQQGGAEPVSYPEDAARPRTRGECEAASRPCPWVSCRYHLYLDVTRKGSLKLNFPDLEPWELPQTCALDVADRGEATLDQVGEAMNLSRERVRQLEQDTVRELGRSGAQLANEAVRPGGRSRRRESPCLD